MYPPTNIHPPLYAFGTVDGNRTHNRVLASRCFAVATTTVLGPSLGFEPTQPPYDGGCCPTDNGLVVEPGFEPRPPVCNTGALTVTLIPLSSIFKTVWVDSTSLCVIGPTEVETDD